MLFNGFYFVGIIISKVIIRIMGTAGTIIRTTVAHRLPTSISIMVSKIGVLLIKIVTTAMAVEDIVELQKVSLNLMSIDIHLINIFYFLFLQNLLLSLFFFLSGS
jgi:hypothetical protein